MAITNKIMKTFNVPNGSNTTCYEIVDDKGRKCIAKDWYANSTAKFNAGEYVIKDGVCYRFTTTHAANTSWSSSEVAATNLGAELSDVKSAFVYNCDTGMQTFAFYNGDFQLGGLNVDGSLKPAQTYRVSSNHTMVFDRDIHVTAKSGYKWGYIDIVGGTAGAWKGWYTNDVITIPKNTEFVVQIAKDPENQSQTADVSTFVSTIVFNTALKEDVSTNTKNIEDIHKSVTSINDNFGSFQSGHIETIEETVEGQTSNIYVLERIIPAGTSVIVTNKSATTNISLNLIDVYGESTSKGTILKGGSITFNAPGYIEKIRSYVDGTDWNIEIKYGYNLDKKFDGIDQRIDINSRAAFVKQYGISVENGTPMNTSNTQCVRTPDFIPVKMGDVVEMYTTRPLSEDADRYIYGVYLYDSLHTLIKQASPTDRKNETDKYTVDYFNASYLKYAVTEIDDSDNIISLRESDFSNYNTIVAVYNKPEKTYSYAYTGETIDTKAKKYAVEKTVRFVPSAGAAGSTTMQGFAIYGDKIIQCYSGDSKITITDLLTGSVLATLTGNVNHGNAIDFFTDKYDADDPFPYALVSDGLTNEAYKARITLSGVTIVETIKFPVEHCGYYVSTALDKINNIIYTVGYAQNSYTIATNNKMIIAKWDYNDLTTNQDGSVTPSFIGSFNLQFMTTLQGPTYYNGRMYIISSKASQTEANTIIYVVDPYNERISSVLDEFPDAIKNYECEAVYFYEHVDGVYGYLRSAYGGAPFYRIAFNS